MNTTPNPSTPSGQTQSTSHLNGTNPINGPSAASSSTSHSATQPTQTSNAMAVDPRPSTSAHPNPNANGDDDDEEEEDAKGPRDPDSELRATLGAEADLPQAFAARREEELARRDRSLAEFLVMLDGYKPLIPEEVTEYYLQRSGFECSDPRLKRLLSLSAQKFISDLSRDAYHFAKLRVNSTAAGRGRPSAADRNRVVLTMDDLSLALGEHGVNVKKPDYYL